MASSGLTSLTTLSSTLFRVVSYIFLRVIPARILKTLIPSLYVLYLSSLYLDSLSAGAEVAQDGKEVTAEEKEKEKRLPPLPNGSHVKVPEIQRTIPALALSIFASSHTFSPRTRIANIAINTLLLFAAVELVLYPVFDDASDVIFTRVGAVYPDAAKIVVRYPQVGLNETEVQVVWRQASTNNVQAAWKTGPVAQLSAERDWVNTVRLGGLWPSTGYEYRLQDANETLLPYPAEPIRFKTFPDPRLAVGSHFRFLATSCATPNFPYAPLQGRRIKGYDLLADYLWPKPKSVAAPLIVANASVNDTSLNETASSTTSSVAPSAPSVEEAIPTEFMLFLGDFIYADVPMYFGDDKESYRRLYRRNYQSPSYRKVYERLPVFHTYDDHEIINNYAGQGNDTKPPFQNATDAFQLYNVDANYDSKAKDDVYYYDFRRGDVAFFVMDTRRYRSNPEDGSVTTRTMLGEKQLGALYEWLGKVNSTSSFKFIVTSVPFTSLWTHDAQTDSWAGYESEKTALLSVLHTVPNVIILSGDRHEFAAIEFNPDGFGHRIVEVSTSPLSMFYVPLIRTLRQASESTVNSTKVIDGEELVVEIPQERVLKYIASGNYKWSSFEVDTRDLQHPVVHLEVLIDGSVKSKLLITGQPVHLSSPTALGALIPQGVKGIFNKIGLSPIRWF